MMCLDEDALLCDFAETYGIYDLRSLPIQTVATLAVGLRGDSRIKMKMRGAKMPSDASFLLAMIVDRITDVMTWFGAYKENPKPSSALDLLYSISQGSESPFETFEDFDKARKKFLR